MCETVLRWWVVKIQQVARLECCMKCELSGWDDGSTHSCSSALYDVRNRQTDKTDLYLLVLKDIMAWKAATLIK